MSAVSVTESRVAAFDTFRASLEKEERADLDHLVERTCETFRKTGRQFGPHMAKELLMALVEFKADQPIVR